MGTFSPGRPAVSHTSKLVAAVILRGGLTMNSGLGEGFFLDLIFLLFFKKAAMKASQTAFSASRDTKQGLNLGLFFIPYLSLALSGHGLFLAERPPGSIGPFSALFSSSVLVVNILKQNIALISERMVQSVL